MRTWLTKLAVFLVFLIWGPSAKAQKFYPDDPLEKEPPPWPVIEPGYRALSPVLEFFSNTLTEPGQRQPEIGVIPTGGVNTLGEVMDGAWFVNRHGRHRMTNEALMRGPGDQLPPSMDGKWQALTVKGFGIRPGILIADSERQLYLLRFDPLGYLEMATGAEMYRPNSSTHSATTSPRITSSISKGIRSKPRRAEKTSPAWVRREISKKRTSTDS